MLQGKKIKKKFENGESKRHTTITKHKVRRIIFSLLKKCGLVTGYKKTKIKVFGSRK